MVSGHRLCEHSVLLAFDPSTSGVLALQTEVALPAPNSDLGNDVDRTRSHHLAVAAYLDLQDRLDVDSGRNSLPNWIMALQKIRKTFQRSATQWCG